MAIELKITGEDMANLKEELLKAAEDMGLLKASDEDPRGGRPTPPPAAMPNGHDPEPDTSQDNAPPTTRRRRAREAPADQAPEAPPAATVDIPGMRVAATDILRQCYTMPGGGPKVIDLQKNVFNVHRFAEVSDARVPELHKAALDLQAELTGNGPIPPATDSGPF
jgi:hypothetical protein